MSLELKCDDACLNGSTFSGGLFCYCTDLACKYHIAVERRDRVSYYPMQGYIVLSGSLELASRNITSGSVRIGYAVIYSLFLGFGLS